MRPKTALPHSADSVPAPGTYNISSTVGKDAPAVSMSGRHAVRADNFQPGPGTYNLQQVGEVGKDAPHVSMAGRHDTTTTADSVPGPGSYNVQAPRTGGITMAARHEDRVDDWKVAPGTYNVPSASDGPSYSMSGRQELKTEQLAPGPGHYSIDSSIGKAPAASISGRHALKEDRFQPGPGQYSASYEQSKHSAPAYSMRPKTALPHSADSVPAPGTYNISSTVGKDAPAVSMSGRHAVRADNFQPGPGTYNLQQVGEVGKDCATRQHGRPTRHHHHRRQRARPRLVQRAGASHGRHHDGGADTRIAWTTGRSRLAHTTSRRPATVRRTP